MLDQSTWLDPESASTAADAALRSWDWRKTLDEQERKLTWLAKHTNRAQTTVYKYSQGTLTPPLDWLRSAARALGYEAAA